MHEEFAEERLGADLSQAHANDVSFVSINCQN